VASLIRRHQSTLAQYFLVGLAVGVVFGAAIVGVNVWHAPGRTLPWARLLGLSVNEIVFPIGCVAVLHFISRLNDLSAASEPRTVSEPVQSSRNFAGEVLSEDQD
jgi:L-cystine uptake protein TcyP (sodium:dicarboxylate symporter family)